MSKPDPTPSRSANGHDLPAARVLWLRLISVSLLFAAATAVAQTEPRQQRLGGDVYTSAGEITTSADAEGDAFVAGGRIALTGTVGGDALLAGGSVNIDSSVGEDVYAAGGEVRLGSTVGGDARIAGGRVIVAPNAAVKGSATIAGGNVRLDGSIGGYALISAGRTEVNGTVAGDLRVVGGSLALGPQAVVEGRLDYRGAQPASVAPGAQIHGGIEQATMKSDYSVSVGMLAVWLAGMVIAVAALLALGPRASHIVARSLRGRPVASGLLGLALFIALPILGGLLALTVVGLPVGVLILAAWLVLVMLGYFATAIALGDAWAEKQGPAKTARRILAAACAVAVLFIVGQIPYVGWLVWAVALWLGIGAIALTIAEGLRLRPAGTR